jgi:SWIM/SEC-C metal-binding protein
MAKLGSQQKPLVIRVPSESRALELYNLCQSNNWHVIIGIEPNIKEDISDLKSKLNPDAIVRRFEKVGRNEPCPCGSEKKSKSCCLRIQSNLI